MRILDWQAPQHIGDVEVPVLVGRDGDKAGKVTVPVYSWTISRLPGSNTGHGHVWERPDRSQESCGWPDRCGQCEADEELIAEMQHSVRAATERRGAEILIQRVAATPL